MRRKNSILILNIVYWSFYIFNKFSEDKPDFQSSLIIAFMYFFTTLILINNNERI